MDIVSNNNHHQQPPCVTHDTSISNASTTTITNSMKVKTPLMVTIDASCLESSLRFPNEKNYSISGLNAFEILNMALLAGEKQNVSLYTECFFILFFLFIFDRCFYFE